MTINTEARNRFPQVSLLDAEKTKGTILLISGTCLLPAMKSGGYDKKLNRNVHCDETRPHEVSFP